MKGLSPDARFALRNLGKSLAKPATDKGGVFNVGKIGEARLDLIPKLEDCKPGLLPVEYNVIIAPAKAAETVGSGAILVDDNYRETAEMAMQIGRIVAMSPLAFNYDEWKDCPERKPQVGHIVWFARYAGGLIEAGFDGNTYRIVKDKDIAAVIEAPTVTLGE